MRGEGGLREEVRAEWAVNLLNRFDKVRRRYYGHLGGIKQAEREIQYYEDKLRNDNGEIPYTERKHLQAKLRNARERLERHVREARKCEEEFVRIVEEMCVVRKNMEGAEEGKGGEAK